MATENLRITLVPTPEDFQIIDVFMGGSGIIAPDALRSLKLPDGVEWEKGVVINGRGPIWLYSALTHMCHISAWVAVFSPRDGGAIVVQSHSSSGPQVGDVIATQRLKPYLPQPTDVGKARNQAATQQSAAIAFVGPPHSGKSVLMNALRVALRNRLSTERFQRQFYVLRACPDGEGDWFDDLTQDEAKTLRYKNRFDDQFVSEICSQLERLRAEKPLLFVDCGGRIDKKNQCILNLCTHVIIVSADAGEFAKWRGAAEVSELKVLGEVESSDREEAVVLQETPLRVRIGKLERGKRNIALPNQLITAILKIRSL